MTKYPTITLAPVMSEVHSIWFVIEYVQQYNDAVIEAIRRSYSRRLMLENGVYVRLCLARMYERY